MPGFLIYIIVQITEIVQYCKELSLFSSAEISKYRLFILKQKQTVRLNDFFKYFL